MKSSNTRIWTIRLTILLAWILIAYQVPALIENQSKLVEIFGRYSLWYFGILLGYLAILLIITIAGIWLIRASLADGFAERFDSFLSEKQNHVLGGLIVVWSIWIITNQSLFLPAKAVQGINSALYVFSISLILTYIPLVKLDTGFLFSSILIPLGVLSLYCVPLIFFLPEGVNKAFVTQSAKIFLPTTNFLFLAYFSYLGLRKTKLQFFTTANEGFCTSDLVLPLLPITPVVQYLINNSEILSWFEGIVIFGIFLLFASLLIFVVPLLFRNIGSTRPLMFLGMAFAFLITNMASLTWRYKWYQEGSLSIQLLVLVCIWLISCMVFKTKFRSFLYLLIAVHFLSNSIVQFADQDVAQSTSWDQADNMLVTLVDDREPAITPSIYLLVYDSYVINETMLAHGIDNTEQEQYLEGLDFKIYPHTYSVKSSSAATMSRVLNSSTSYYGVSRRAVSGDGVVQNLLKKYGYKTYGVFPTDYFFRGIIPSYDYWFPGSSSSVNLLTKAIFLGELRFDINYDQVPWEEFIQEKRNIFSQVLEEPRFIYMHENLPGHSINAGICRPNEVELYKERLDRANEEMRQDLGMIMKNDPEAILIVAGDHGPYLTKNCTEPKDEYDISEITRLDIQDRNGTFLAIKWPSSAFEEYDDITILQDLFPAIFAYIFEYQGLLEAKIEPITDNGERISGVEVSDGIIVGGFNNGEALFP